MRMSGQPETRSFHRVSTHVTTRAHPAGGVLFSGMRRGAHERCASAEPWRRAANPSPRRHRSPSDARAGVVRADCLLSSGGTGVSIARKAISVGGDGDHDERPLPSTIETRPRSRAVRSPSILATTSGAIPVAPSASRARHCRRCPLAFRGISTSFCAMVLVHFLLLHRGASPSRVCA